MRLYFVDEMFGYEMFVGRNVRVMGRNVLDEMSEDNCPWDEMSVYP